MSKNMEAKRKPIFACLVALDHTADWNIKEQHKQYIRAIKTIYLYDKNERTCLCEFTPSYYLIGQYHEVDLTDYGRNLSEFEQDTLYDYYEQEPAGDPIYVHCHEIDAIEASSKGKKGKKFVWYKSGRTGVSYADSTRDQQLEGLEEYFNGNRVI
jgi:hypothetical protein